MLSAILLLGLLVVAAVTDFLRHKIYNWTTYPGILAALGLNAVGSALLASGQVDRQWLCESLGWIGLAESVFGFLACGVVLLVCFVLFRVGGGDVKLMAMLGAFLGPERGIEAMLWTFVLGGCMGLIVLIWRVGPWRLTVRALRQVFWTLRLGRWNPLTPDERAQLQPPLFLAPSALLAAIIVQFSLVELVLGPR
jgi:prepilin peptidase CpaA